MALVIRERDDLKGCPIDYDGGIFWTVEKAFEFFENESKKTVVMFGREKDLVKICFLNDEKDAVYIRLGLYEKNIINIFNTIQKILISFGLNSSSHIAEVVKIVRIHFSYLICSIILSYPILSTLEKVMFSDYCIQ